MKLLTILLLVVGLVLVATPAFGQTETINFDDLVGSHLPVPNGYEGLQYSNFHYGDGATLGGGYATGTVSSPNVAFDAFGNPANFSRATPFTFNSVYLTAAFTDGLMVEVQGLRGGTLVFDQTVTLSLTTPTLFTFDYTGVTEVNFIASGNDFAAFDNLVVTFGTTFAATPGLTPNQEAVASNIDAASMGAPTANFLTIINALSALPPGALPGALDQLSPEEFGQFTSITAFNNASFETEAMDQYFASQRQGPDGSFAAGRGGIDSSGLTMDDPSYDPGLALVHSRLLAFDPAPFDGTISDAAGPVLGGVDMKDAKDVKSAAEAPAYTDPWNFFVRGNVILGQGFSDADVSHFDDNSESVVLGTDYRITPHFLVGLTAAYGHTDVTLDDSGSSATVDSYSPGLYASYADKGWYANLSGDYVHNAYTQSRVISFLGQTATSAPEGNEGVANLDGGYDFHHGALTYGPIAGIQYTHLTVDGYNEGGSVADLSVNEQDDDSLRSRLGGRICYAFSEGGVSLNPHLDATWQHEFMDQSRGITSQFGGAGVGSFVVRTASPQRDFALADVGLDAVFNHTVTAFADYMVQAGQSNYFGQSVQAGVKIGF